MRNKAALSGNLRVVLWATVIAAAGSLLAGLCVRLLYLALERQGCPAAAVLVSCTAVGLFLYLVTLWMLDIHPLRLFHLLPAARRAARSTTRRTESGSRTPSRRR